MHPTSLKLSSVAYSGPSNLQTRYYNNCKKFTSFCTSHYVFRPNIGHHQVPKNVLLKALCLYFYVSSFSLWPPSLFKYPMALGIPVVLCVLIYRVPQDAAVQYRFRSMNRILVYLHSRSAFNCRLMVCEN
jgi:hypothetical protein